MVQPYRVAGLMGGSVQRLRWACRPTRPGQTPHAHAWVKAVGDPLRLSRVGCEVHQRPWLLVPGEASLSACASSAALM